eukprot:1037309-Rhodomonas_salina.1
MLLAMCGTELGLGCYASLSLPPSLSLALSLRLSLSRPLAHTRVGVCRFAAAVGCQEPAPPRAEEPRWDGRCQ